MFDLYEDLETNGGQVSFFDTEKSAALFDTFAIAGIVYFNPCDINLPHTHPRATETALILEGELLAGIAEENGG